MQGSGNGDVALNLRSGNSQTNGASAQIAFGYNGDTSMRHLLRTQHSTATIGNTMDFLVWTPATGSTATLANMDVMSLQGTTATASGASVHIHPFGSPTSEVTVSDGQALGGGTAHRLYSATHSSRDLKTDIRYLSAAELESGYKDVLGLKHARFRYKTKTSAQSLEPLHLGLIREEAPPSIRGPGGTLVIDYRVLNLEIALQEELKRLEVLEQKLARLRAKE